MFIHGFDFEGHYKFEVVQITTVITAVMGGGINLITCHQYVMTLTSLFLEHNLKH